MADTRHIEERLKATLDAGDWHEEDASLFRELLDELTCLRALVNKSPVNQGLLPRFEVVTANNAGHVLNPTFCGSLVLYPDHAEALAKAISIAQKETFDYVYKNYVDMDSRPGAFKNWLRDECRKDIWDKITSSSHLPEQSKMPRDEKKEP